MNSFLLASVLVVTLCSPGGGGAGQPYEALDAGDVFVATITRVEDKDATNARPPRVWLEVHEVLRGEARAVRSPAVWGPPFHGVDWGDENEPLLKKWKVAPLAGPKVGQKFILGGQSLKAELGEKAAAEKDAPGYYLFAFVQTPYTADARAKTIAQLAFLDAERRKYAEEQAAAVRERELRGRKWRETMTDCVIDRRTQEADAVAIATIVSGGTWQVEEMLKGERRMSSGGTYSVTLPSKGYDQRIEDIVFARPRCILFLSEKDLIASVYDMHTQIIDPYEGVVLADEAAIAAVKKSLQNKPAPKPKPVLVISALDREDAAPLAQAARTSFTVVQSHQFSGHSPNTIVHIRNTIPHAALLVMIDRGPQRRIEAVQITPEGSNTLYKGTWTEKDVTEQAKALAKKLVEKAN